MKPFLSLCMIVKNEENCLSKCLSSVKGLVDEYIIVDTGSSDRTKEIASKYTDTVFDLVWKNDFSYARNAAIKHAKGDWILVLDADEYVEDQYFASVTAFLRNLDAAKPTGIILPVYNFVGEGHSGKISESSAIRIFTNHSDLIFTRPIHEQLVSLSGSMKKIDYKFPIYHTGYTDEILHEKQKSERNLKIFEELKRNGALTPYDSYTLGNEFYMQNQYEPAIQSYRNAYVPSEHEKTWMPLCLGNLCSCYMKLGQYSKALELIRWSQQKWPDKGDFFWLEGFLYEQIGIEANAVESLQTAVNKDYVISPNYVTTLPLQLLSSLHMRLFDSTRAVQTLTALSYANPNHYTVLYELLRLLSPDKDWGRIHALLHAINGQLTLEQNALLLRASASLGLIELAEMLIKDFHADIKMYPLDTQMLYALLKDDWSGFAAALALSGAQISGEYLSIAYAGFMHWPQYESHFTPYQTAFAHMQEADAAASCIILFHQEKFEAFDRIAQQFGTGPRFTNLVADQFFNDQQYELAFDYYSMLLNSNQLDAKGLENIARLYIAQGDVNEGLEFIRKAIEREPDKLHLYSIYYIHADSQEKRIWLEGQLRVKNPQILQILAGLRC